MKRDTVQLEMGEVGAMDGDASIYRRLWSAVLLQAVRDLSATIRQDDAPTVNMPFSGDRLHRWFASEQVTPGSFEWICMVLDMDAGSIRNKLLTDPHVLTGTRKT